MVLAKIAVCKEIIAVICRYPYQTAWIKHFIYT